MQTCIYCGYAGIADGSLVCSACGNPLAAVDLPAGSVLAGKYRVEGLLGRGGFGITYRGTHILLQQSVAIKEYFPEGAIRQGNRVVVTVGGPVQQSFLEEGRRLAQLNHPGIVRVIDVFEENNTAYLVMAHVAGQTLQELIQNRPLGQAQALDYITQTAEALKAVHAAGMLHQDLKPDNLIRTPSGQIVVVDFGASRQFVAQKTGNYDRVVTPGFAPLEQYGNHVRRGPYTDIYALGATLFTLLGGTPPLPAPDRVNHPALTINAQPQVQAAIARAMNIRPADRPQTLEEFLALLKPAPSQPVPPPTPSRRPLWPIVGLLGLGLAVFGLLWFKRDPILPEDSSVPISPTVVAEAPKLNRWYFEGCRSVAGYTRVLVAGQASKCLLVVQRQPSSASISQAEFSYVLKYKDAGGEHAIAVAGIDQWSPNGGNVELKQQPQSLDFTLPIAVKARQDRIYEVIEVTGRIAFDNGTHRTLVEPLIIGYPTQKPAQSAAQTKLPTVPSAPKFVRWYLDGCRWSGGVTGQLVVGQDSRCDLVLEYEPNGSRLVQAVFEYSLKYPDRGVIQELKLPGVDTWTPQGGNVEIVDSGQFLVFTLPLNVRKRPDRIYQSLEVVGKLAFDNDSHKNVLEEVPIAYP